MEIIIIFMLTLLMLVHTQDIGFSKEDEIPDNTPSRISNDSLPVYVPGLCPPNQLLYPGSEKQYWACDCAPGFIYYPASEECYAVYRQGPCDDRNMLILPRGKVIPECVNNPCVKDGFVQYNGRCYELGQSGGPCKAASDGRGTFSVNKHTLALECLGDTSPINTINVSTNCPPGSNRSNTGKCRPKSGYYF